MSSKIRLLSDLTVNQIAAGEVIESPASVVKELVENALDAAASQVTIEIEGGGHLALVVRDDGVGMGKEDAYLAFARHATSKIAAFADLSHLTSMGFRGEALASIASVSKVVLESAEEGVMGTRVEAVGGKILSSTGIARQRGTTIEVRSLFFNVPARKKFQKSASAATQEIVKMVMRLALAHPRVAFNLSSNSTVLFRVQGPAEKRAEEVLGAAFLEGGGRVEKTERDYKLSAFFGPPSAARSNRLGQYLLVNQRSIVSPFLSRVVKEAYGARIGRDAHPIFILWLEVPPFLIDVNVHPQKREVRFQEEPFVEYFLRQAVQQFFQPKEKLIFSALPLSQKMGFTRKKDTSAEEIPLFSPAPEEKHEQALPFPSLIFLAFIGKTALYRTTANQILWIDLAAFYAKKVFDRVKKSLEEPRELELQTLLFPKTLPFSREEIAALEPHLATILQMGIRLNPFGREAMVIDAIAETVSLEEVEEMLTSFLDATRGGIDIEKCARIAASHARKQSYTTEEAYLIAKEIMQQEELLFSPKGKRIARLLEEDKFVELLS